VLVALLAIGLDYAGAGIERAVVSPGVRERRGRRSRSSRSPSQSSSESSPTETAASPS
jgi:hypothetical protein